MRLASWAAPRPCDARDFPLVRGVLLSFQAASELRHKEGRPAATCRIHVDLCEAVAVTDAGSPVSLHSASPRHRERSTQRPESPWQTPTSWWALRSASAERHEQLGHGCLPVGERYRCVERARAPCWQPSDRKAADSGYLNAVGTETQLTGVRVPPGRARLRPALLRLVEPFADSPDDAYSGISAG